MPPARTKKTRSSTSSNEAIPSFPAPPTMIPTKQDEGARTPSRTPSKRVAGITQAQKQALIDNLQLEVTERARKLRAQYALQAQGLRARLEMRVNRIPQALRKRNMQALLDEYAGREKPQPAPPVPAKDTTIKRIAAPPTRSPERKSLKRQSTHISRDDDDKENTPVEDLPVAKKRAKTAQTANTKATRTASRKVVPSTVLSPKSHNSRTLPRSPFKTIDSPQKPALGRPPSPVKPSVQHLAPPPASRAGAQSRAGSRQAKARPATAMASDADGRSSEASNTSAGTTIVHKIAAGAKKGAAAARKAPAAVKTAAAGRKPAAAAKKVEVQPAAVTRTLRKRG